MQAFNSVLYDLCNDAVDEAKIVESSDTSADVIPTLSIKAEVYPLSFYAPDGDSHIVDVKKICSDYLAITFCCAQMFKIRVFAVHETSLILRGYVFF